jgi:hypothetical protein
MPNERPTPKQIWEFNVNGYLISFDPSSDFGQGLPPNSTYTSPGNKVQGKWPKWDIPSQKWTQVEDHRGKRGYVNGQPVDITDFGPLPEGWSEEWVDPRTLEEIRLAEIDARLAEIDMESVRPLRAQSAGDATEYDTNKLAALENEAASLRTERAALVAQMEAANA